MNADQKASNEQKVDASALKNITKCKRGIHKIFTAKTLERKFETNILVLNFHTPVSVSDLYILRMGSPILMQQDRWTDRGNI